MSDDIDDIQDPRYHMSRRTFFQLVHEPSDILLTCTWVYMGLDGFTCSESLPVGTWHFEPRARATDLGQGPNLTPLRAGSLRATEPRARDKTRARKRKKIRSAKKTHLYIVIPGSLRDVCDVKSGGWRKLMKRDTKATQQWSQLIYVRGNME